jgi:putative nucleotidyltransferase with HDIG domain
MIKLRSLLTTFQARVTIIFIASMLFIAALSNFLIYRYALQSQINNLRRMLMATAQITALTIDTKALMSVPLRKNGTDSRQFKRIANKLNKVIETNPLIEDIYTMKKTDVKGKWQFIVDPQLADEEQLTEGISNFPGDFYDASRFPEMMKAFDEPAADKQLLVDEWGVTISGYAPIRDPKGKVVAMVGVDVAADDVYALQKGVRLRALYVLLLGTLLSFLLGVVISRWISKPVKQLVVGIRHIADGDLEYQVKEQGADEIKTLASSFNSMAQGLKEARKKLHSYFYRVIQALIRIMEAKDPYTRGHSERVAEYAQKIAQKLGLPPQQVELVKESAVLHDIGKLGIDEKIIDKPGKLTDDEWELLRKHPELGVTLLKPVLLSDEMEQAIRSHQERADGKGYPDHLDSLHTHLFAQIIAVVDAYDAMTSTRSYRKALTKKYAIEELRKNEGKQFDAKIVEVFIDILKNEK